MFTENLSVFLADFGKSATFSRADGAPLGTFKGIFNTPDLCGSIGTAIQIQANERAFLMRTDQAYILRQDDTAFIEEEPPLYVVEKHDDGTGFTTLILAPTPSS